MCACAGISDQQNFITIPLFTFIHTLLSLKYYASDTRSGVNIYPYPGSLLYLVHLMQYKWAFFCLSLSSGIYISAGIQIHYLTIPEHWAGQNMWLKPQRLVCMTRMTSIMSSSLVLLLLFVRVNVAFNNFSVISRRCLVATGSSMLTFIVLRHWNIMPQTLEMLPHPFTLSWHCLDRS